MGYRREAFVEANNTVKDGDEWQFSIEHDFFAAKNFD
jgi:hypothetical protein